MGDFDSFEDFGVEVDEAFISLETETKNDAEKFAENNPETQNYSNEVTTEKKKNDVDEMTFKELYDFCAAQDAENSTLTESTKKMNQARLRRQQIIRRKQPQSRVWDGQDTNINLNELLEARGEEVEMCEKVVMSNHEKMAVTQRVPIFMRRRVMNHHMRRIPVFARLQALRSLSGAAAKSKKMKYKKHRIRKLCKSMDFRRRQKTFRWLETHLWHAKRFKIIEKWGYKIPLYCNDRILRSLHRDVTSKTAVCDVSYYCWLELEGQQNALLPVLSLLTNQATGLGFGANDLIDGSKEGNVVLYEPGRYPRGCIGPVSFIWKPPESDDFVGKTREEKYSCTVKRKLWIGFHPSMKFPLLKVLESVLEKGDIAFKNLEKCLNCFEFYGPDTLKILQEIIHFSHADLQYTEKFELAKDRENLRRVKKKFWWNSCYDTETARSNLNTQKTSWENVKKEDFTTGQIISIVARDPRVACRRRHGTNETNVLQSCIQSLTPHSFIWDDDVRDYVTRRKLSNNQVNKHLSNRSPFSMVDVFDEEARIPILLIRKSGLPTECHDILKPTLSSHYSQSIWKLIVPRNWAMPFWILFKKMRLRVMGLRERERFNTRGKHLVYPRDFPDSLVGRFACKQSSAELNRVLKRKPLSKRFNFERFGIQNPFECEYEKLVSTTFAECNVESVSQNATPVLVNEMKSCLFDEKVLNPVLNFTLPRQQKMKRRKADEKWGATECNPPKKKKVDIGIDSKQEVYVKQKCEFKKDADDKREPDAASQDLIPVANLPVGIEVEDLPLNCSDLTSCMKLPLLTMIEPAPECAMKLSEILSAAPSFLRSDFQLEYYIMRDRIVLCEMQSLLDAIQTSKKQPANVLRSLKKLQTVPYADSALVLVHLTLLSNGTFTKGADIFSPTADDAINCGNALKNKVPKVAKAKLQPVHRRIRKKEVKAAKKAAKLASEDGSTSEQLNQKVAEMINKQIRKQPIVNQQKDESQKRNVIGCLTYSEYDYAVGKVMAIAVISFKELLEMISLSKWFVFVANKIGSHFCPAELKILTGS